MIVINTGWTNTIKNTHCMTFVLLWARRSLLLSADEYVLNFIRHPLSVGMCVLGSPELDEIVPCFQ